jgi:hypothetical protein
MRLPGMDDEVSIASGGNGSYQYWNEEEVLGFVGAPPQFAEPIETVRARIAETVDHVAVPHKVRTWHPASPGDTMGQYPKSLRLSRIQLEPVVGAGRIATVRSIELRGSSILSCRVRSRKDNSGRILHHLFHFFSDPFPLMAKQLDKLLDHK